VIDIVRRALEGILLMSTDAMNGGGMAAHDTGFGRAAEAIFRPRTRAGYVAVRALHHGLLRQLEGLRDAAGTPARIAAAGALQSVLARLREYDQVGDLTDAGRGRMPAMMRGADGRHLALTRRQRSKVEAAIRQFGAAGPAPSSEEQNLRVLISALSFASGLHAHIDVGGRSLTDLFTDPAELVTYLRTGTAKGPLAGASAGQPLIVPGDPAASAFFRLITDPAHPMFGPFSAAVPSLNKTGREVVEEWIRSLA
jgi:hypothetical protein